MKPPEMLPPEVISSLWKYTQCVELIEGKTTGGLVSTLLMNGQNALFAESHRGVSSRTNSTAAEARALLRSRLTGLRNIQ